MLCSQLFSAPLRTVPVRGIGERLFPRLLPLLPRSVQTRWAHFVAELHQEGRREIPHSQVSVYVSEEFLRGAEWGAEWGGASPRLKEAVADVSLDELRSRVTAEVGYSIATAVLNQGRAIERWLDAVQAQSAPPAEVIICDRGSEDDTLERIKAWGKKHREFPLFLLRQPSLNACQGLNKAVESTKSGVVLISDVLAPPTPRWAETLLLPFFAEPELAAVFGRAVIERGKTPMPVANTVAALSHSPFATFQPASALFPVSSLALKREAWRAVGGFPEYLSVGNGAGVFSYFLKCRYQHFAFVPEAVAVRSEAATLIDAAAEEAQAVGEGERIFWGFYSWLLGAAGMSLFELALLTGVWSVAALVLSLFFSWGGGVASVILVLATVPLVLSVRNRVREILHRYLPEQVSTVDVSPAGLSTTGLSASGVSTTGAAPDRTAGSVLRLAGAQARGFLRGYRGRAAAEARRLAGVAGGFLVVITEELPEFHTDTPLANYLSERLSAGWYVVVLLADQRRVDAARRFDHPHYEEHLLVDFPPQAWGEKHSRFISGKKFQLLSLLSSRLTSSQHGADRKPLARKQAEEMETHLRSLGAEPVDVPDAGEAEVRIAHE